MTPSEHSLFKIQRPLCAHVRWPYSDQTWHCMLGLWAVSLPCSEIRSEDLKIYINIGTYIVIQIHIFIMIYDHVYIIIYIIYDITYMQKKANMYICLTYLYRQRAAQESGATSRSTPRFGVTHDAQDV